ncbi:unnamed protein product [Didymodactylos carnosus]|uniref:Uncharacterized protein n=1 Tax=Didymodactylos carnosus TaxID=1234261 RepID=A0A816AZH8_9BILA|nr:unnamed protein product [Didymodactylos carnosus]CAF1602111.1 unnamed protein product [Didymodactylos carnosus]CAF3923860.1 unnamed protein product [Didymodactylos carnosus]CAF4479899.1 unnamed protein product [Didymodactylos carnosus]
MLASNQHQQSPLSTDTRGAPKALEVFTIDTRDPTVPLQAAQLIQRSGADPVIWISTELTRTTSAGNFRLYKDGSGIFGLWVPNSQAFYSDAAPPNICAPDAQSDIQLIGPIGSKPSQFGRIAHTAAARIPARRQSFSRLESKSSGNPGSSV